MFLSDYCCCFELPRNRLVTLGEAQALGENAKLEEAAVHGISIENIHEEIGKIAFFSPQYRDGTNSNLIECTTSSSSVNCYRAFPIVYAKYSAYTFYPRNSQYIFGCTNIYESDFCINCYYSAKLMRCFEVDSGRDCSGCYFCHNIENVHDSMFCFNTKNNRYAIGNVEVGRKRFLKAKELLLRSLSKRLAEKKEIDLDIFDLAKNKNK